MSKQDGEDPTWKERHDEVVQAFELAKKAKVIASQIDGPYVFRSRIWQSEADGLIASFAFFLSGEPIPSGYRFAGWIEMPKHLLNEMSKTMAMFGVVLKDVPKEQVHGQLILF